MSGQTPTMADDRNAKHRRWRATAKETRRRRAYVTEHPDLTADEVTAAVAFLNGCDPELTPAARAVLRQHLIARRAHANATVRAMLARLDPAR